MFGKGLSVATVPFYPCGDRFVVAVYRTDPLTFEQKLEKVAELGDVKGVERRGTTACVREVLLR